MIIDILNEAQLSQLDQLITTADIILITCHKSPDGDAIGSCLGWAEYLRSRGKEPTIVVPDQFPDFLMWLPNTEKIVRYDKHKEKCDMLFKIADLIFCLDFNATSRVSDMEPALVGSPAPKVLIDHHLDPTVPAVLSISHPEACSTCELVFRIAWQMNGFQSLGRQFAIPVYCGMMTDTGGFLYNSSRPEIYFIIGELLTKHIDKDRYLPEYHTAYYTINKDELRRFHFIKGDAEGLVNIPQQIKGLRLSISLREDTEKKNLIWVSLRSVDQFPCNKMASEFFNGGGHLNASGGHLDMTMEEAVETVRRAIIAYAEMLK